MVDKYRAAQVYDSATKVRSRRVRRERRANPVMRVLGSSLLRVALSFGVLVGVLLTQFGRERPEWLPVGLAVAAGVAAAIQLSDLARRSVIDAERNTAVSRALSAGNGMLEEIQNTHSYGRHGEHVKFRKRVLSNAKSLVESCGLKEVRISYYLATLEEVEGADRGVSSLVYSAHVGIDKPVRLLERKISVHESIFETCVDQDRPMAIVRRIRVKAVPALVSRGEFMAAVRERSWNEALRVPVRHDKECVGVLILDSPRRFWCQDPVYTTILDAAARQIVSLRALADGSLDSATLNERMRERLSPEEAPSKAPDVRAGTTERS